MEEYDEKGKSQIEPNDWISSVSKSNVIIISKNSQKN